MASRCLIPFSRSALPASLTTKTGARPVTEVALSTQCADQVRLRLVRPANPNTHSPNPSDRARIPTLEAWQQSGHAFAETLADSNEALRWSEFSARGLMTALFRSFRNLGLTVAGNSKDSPSRIGGEAKTQAVWRLSALMKVRFAFFYM
jgi:hypothetical protein